MFELKVIELASGPGAGKSTAAAGLFNLMKGKGESVELVTEVAKDYTYAKRFHELGNQFQVLAEQDARLRRLVGNVEWAISDSPLWLGLVYADPVEFGHWFKKATMDRWRQYQNRTFLIRRVKAYYAYGRNQTEEQARELDDKIERIWASIIPWREQHVINGDHTAPWDIAAATGLALKWQQQESDKPSASRGSATIPK